MRVLIVDEKCRSQNHFDWLCQVEPQFEHIERASTWKEALEKAALLKPHLIFLDERIPNGSYPEAVDKFIQHCPGVKIIILTEEPSEDNLLRALRCRISGYLIKGLDLPHMLSAICNLNPGEFALSPRLTQMLLDRMMDFRSILDLSKIYTLTSREREVFHLLCMGVSNREIANSLVISENTVRIHVHNILKKLNLKNRWKVQEKYALVNALPKMPAQGLLQSSLQVQKSPWVNVVD